MGNKPPRMSHKIPRMSSQIKAKLQLRNPPVRLHRRARIALDGQVTMFMSFYRSVIEHRVFGRIRVLVGDWRMIVQAAMTAVDTNLQFSRNHDAQRLGNRKTLTRKPMFTRTANRFQDGTPATVPLYECMVYDSGFASCRTGRDYQAIGVRPSIGNQPIFLPWNRPSNENYDLRVRSEKCGQPA